MIRSLYTSATGMSAQQLNVDVIANNLANVNTTGFRRSRVEFQDLFYQTLRAPGAPSVLLGTEVPMGLQVGLGVRPVGTSKIFLQGTFEKSNNPFDIAIEGNGFFQVQKPNGEIAYTRAGSFSPDSQGRLMTPDGLLLSPELAVPSDAVQVSIEKDGTVSALIDGEITPVELGTVELARFVNPGGLQSVGDNLFLPTAASGEPIVGIPGEEGFGQLSQGFLESSNVNTVEELVHMILAQRAYELNSRVVQASDEMLQTANGLKR
ncbi:MAG: flagellar basal-body rod protein FlgG [Nitrospirae bacterium]|nr:flagellar basal-body rod protein FlgG [Nitrospirota bacterium]